MQALQVQVWAPQVDELLKHVGSVAYIAGGAARQLVLDRDAPNAEDIDLFLLRPEAYGECCRVVQALGYSFLGETDNVGMYDPRTPAEIAIQVIRPFRDAQTLTYGTPEDVLAHFSFTTEQFALALRSGVIEAIVGDDSIRHTIDRELVLNNITDPLIVAMRMVKYAYKGYAVNMADMHRLFVEWERRPLAWKIDVAKAQASPL